MYNSKIKISFLAIAIFCLLWGPLGCGGDEESAPAQPEVVATRIAVSAPKPAKADKKPAAQAQAKAAQTAAPAGEKAVTDDSTLQKTMAGIEKAAAAGSVSRYQARLYKPEGKVDPFKPPFDDTKEPPDPDVTEEDSNAPDRPPGQTPLERIDLSQLTLVGVIKFSSGYQAIVEEQSGKGYVIKEGTYIGTNYGQVAEIQDDRIIIQEKVKDLLGKYQERKSHLKLQKPLGEN